MSTVFTGSVNIYMERQQNCLHFTEVETKDAGQLMWREQSWGL